MTEKMRQIAATDKQIDHQLPPVLDRNAALA
jgi:hypothetical protein